MSESEPIEIAARAAFEQTFDIPWDEAGDHTQDCWREEQLIVIAALESAGFRIVAREATEKMAFSANGIGPRIVRDIWQSAWDAAPVYNTGASDERE